MESNGKPTLRPSADDARASLDAVARVNADLATRLVTPWWFHPALGLVQAMLILALTSHVGWLQWLVIVFSLALIGIVVRAYTALTGLGMSRQYYALAREWFIALALVVAVAWVVVLVVDEPWVPAVAAGVAFVATVILGRSADRAIRDRLRDSTGILSWA